MKIKNLILTLTFIGICIFMAPLYIDLFTGSKLTNTYPWIPIGFGALSVILLLIYKTKIK